MGYINAYIYRYDGKTWQQYWVAPTLNDYRFIAISSTPNGVCYLLGARPPAQVLRVDKNKTEVILKIPGQAMSLLADRKGNPLVGTMGYDLILLEKVTNGFRMHHLIP
ncbi:MAG TPA: hypothetical protein PKA06_07160 [Gemmatales bacterium]|nr:hypothetical protein [Gemmatales bacterium]HMP18531.1 hypothetical protein [Gemmatales bacterium]